MAACKGKMCQEWEEKCGHWKKETGIVLWQFQLWWEDKTLGRCDSVLETYENLKQNNISLINYTFLTKMQLKKFYIEYLTYFNMFDYKWECAEFLNHSSLSPFDKLREY